MKTDDMGDGWAKFTVLEKGTKKFYNNYYYKRVKAHRFEIDTPKAKALSAYTLIEKDLRSVRIWLEEIGDLIEDDCDLKGQKKSIKSTKDRKKFNLVKGLFVAALTFYAKCFATCEGRRLKIEKKNLSPEFQESHNGVLEMRHNFAAHSGAKQVEKVHVVLALDSKKRKNAIPLFTRELAQPDTFIKDDIDDFISLVDHVKSFVDGKIEILNKKVLEDDVLSKGAEYWYNKT